MVGVSQILNTSEKACNLKSKIVLAETDTEEELSGCVESIKNIATKIISR